MTSRASLTRGRVLYTGAISQTDKFFNKMNVFTVERIQKWTNLLGLLILTACLSWGLREVTPGKRLGCEGGGDGHLGLGAVWLGFGSLV